MMKRILFPLLALLSFVLAAKPLLAQQAVDLELVLAVDSSSSVSKEEFDLQMKGLAAAFRHPVVVEAARTAGDRGIAAAVIQWSDEGATVMAVDWHLLNSVEATANFAAKIDAAPRYIDGGGTSLGAAINYSMGALLGNRFLGRRKVIDISGDGRANQGERPQHVRDRAVLAGITINGLAILNEDPNMDKYYKENVAGGTGAFVISATNYEDFANAMIEKLVREISGPPIVKNEQGDEDLQEASAAKSPLDAEVGRSGSEAEKLQ